MKHRLWLWGGFPEGGILEEERYIQWQLEYLALLAQPWVGASWKGFVIEQAIGTLSTRGIPFEAFYLRTSDKHEIDLILNFGNER